ncbi:glycoside hydrolase family 9 protein [Croceicoccus marinus]|uniref:Glycoside hydrolase family 9 protein n=1 Tax=Croceicoccus marinus TaxID=450378 RepID=A0A7G6VTK4_9SPHN|nr:glycoside hydrolase family 9 protein [Croceicoccus marinus]QNE05069.1 glycoside hydrolase family 9 protein [Croceicoccus marinus]
MDWKRILLGSAALAALAGGPAAAQDAETLDLSESEYFEAPGANVLVFSNWYDGLFADSKISGVELIQQGERIATNGDVRLSATPGQWDPIGRMVDRKVDVANGRVEVTLEYPQYDFRYRIVAQEAGEAVKLTVLLDEPLPQALAGKAGLNLEFLPSAYFRQSYFADGKPGAFPRYPAANMVAGGERNAASGRDIGPGAEPLPMATGRTLVLAPNDPARRVTIQSAGGDLALYDGRNQAQNGWFVVRGLLPAGQTGTVAEWTLTPNAVPGWTREPVIGHSQLGYVPQQEKHAVIEMDASDTPAGEVRLLRIDPQGNETVAASGAPQPWGDYLRYGYATFDFSQVREPGLYTLEYRDQRTAPFRIAEDVYENAWHPGMDVFMPVQMDHMLVNEAYRVWHGDPHRDDGRQAPVNHEHIDLYRQGPTTDTRFQPGEHIPGMTVGGWLDAGDFDIRTQTQYAVVRELAHIWDQFRPERDQTLVDHDLRRVEIHVPDGHADIQQQIAHGVLYLVSMYDAVGHAVHGVVEPDVAQYTHLGDAASKTDGLIYDETLEFGERTPTHSGTPDDRWIFTTRASALDYGTAAALAAASRSLKGFDDALAAKALRIAEETWQEEQSRPPFTYSHGNTTGGWLPGEEFTAAAELLNTTGKPQYAKRVAELWPEVSEQAPQYIRTALSVLPRMPAGFRSEVEKAARKIVSAKEPFTGPNPYGVPITTGGWAGNGAIMQSGLTDYAIHKAFPELSDGSGVYRALDYIHGTHPASNLSFVSGVGAQSKEVAYGSNRADFSFIPGGVVPGVLVIKPDYPENQENWPFFWGQNEYVVNMTPAYVALVQSAIDLNRNTR